MKYQKRFVDEGVLYNALQESGLKSVMFGGEGEPFLHPNFLQMVANINSLCIDIGITTNGSIPFEDALPYCKWIKVSVNGLKSYKSIHGKDDFDTVYRNIKNAVKRNSECTIGVQSLLLPDNADELYDLAGLMKNLGVDYFVAKPYSQHPKSKVRDFDNFCASSIKDKVKRLASKDFAVIWRDNAEQKIGKPKPYSKCHAMPFWSYIDSGGNVWGCSNYLTDDKFLYGNIYKDDVGSIWKYRQQPDVDVQSCRDACRMDECNRYLENIVNPSGHVNFI